MFQELYDSFLECSKNKSNTINAINFIINKEKNLMQLKFDLESRTYTPWKSIYFVVTHPKPREVFAWNFRDRIIHHFFVRSIEKNFYKELTNSAYSCLKDRWTHKCISDVKKIFNNYKYYLQIDIKSFFMSIDKNILKKQLWNYLPKTSPECKEPGNINYDLDIYHYLLEVILKHNPIKNCVYKWNPALKKLILPHKSLFHCKDGVGMPIWNYTSQFFANVYLNDLDKYIKEQLWIKDYFRYVDDLLIFDNDYKKLQDIVQKIDNYLKTYLNMTLARDKTSLKQTSHWLDFLWYFIKPYATYTRKRVKQNLLTKIIINYFLYIY